MRRELLRAYPGAAIEQCTGGEEGLALLRRQRFDVLLLDLVMADGGGIELLRQAREEGMLGSTGVIVVSGAPYIEELTALFPTRLELQQAHAAAQPRLVPLHRGPGRRRPARLYAQRA